jgi:hypothetical protein
MMILEILNPLFGYTKEKTLHEIIFLSQKSKVNAKQVVKKAKVTLMPHSKALSQLLN